MTLSITALFDLDPKVCTPGKLRRCLCKSQVELLDLHQLRDPGMIPRIFADELKRQLQEFPAVTVIGPRQSVETERSAALAHQGHQLRPQIEMLLEKPAHD